MAICALLFKPAESFAPGFAFLSLFNNELACFAAADVSFEAAAVVVAAGLAASALTVSFFVAALFFIASSCHLLQPLVLYSSRLPFV